jgi:hypothetical protein
MLPATRSKVESPLTNTYHWQLACQRPDLLRPLLIGPRRYVNFLLLPTLGLVEIKPIQSEFGSPLEINMGPTFQIVTWSLFGVLLIAYIAVKMSKRRKQN